MLHATRGMLWGVALLMGVIGIMSMLGLRTYAQEELMQEEMLLEEGVIDDGEIPDAFMDGELLEDIVPADTVSCFDYYAFGSIQANLSAPVVGTVSGAPITFEGTLENENPYPVVDGVLYVKIFKSRGDTDDGNGPDVVDQFIAKSDVVIPARGAVPVSFQWRVPSYAQSGEYSVATFFTTSRKFNLLGLSFTDDVIGNTVPFTVVGEQEEGVSFEKSGVTINDEPYFFTAFPPRTDATSDVVLKATVNNTVGSTQNATLSWSVYQWDAQLRSNVVQEETSQIAVPAGVSEVSIRVTDTAYPVYLVVGTLKWMDTQSIIGARFVRDGVDRTRINFPGITSFPLVAGQPNTLFSCLHNAGSGAVVSGGSLDLSILDREGNIIHEYRYDGDITGAMMGVASEFTPRKDYDYFRLNARLFQDGEFVDEANLVYDCNDIDPAQCAPEDTSAGGFLASIEAIATIVGGIVVLMIAFLVYRRIGRPRASNLPPM